jgi:hypothetical protein
MSNKNLPEVKIDQQKTTIEIPHTYLARLSAVFLRLLLSTLVSGSTVSLPPEQPPAHPPIIKDANRAIDRVQ